jgi:hypothetical protein
MTFEFFFFFYYYFTDEKVLRLFNIFFAARLTHVMVADSQKKKVITKIAFSRGNDYMMLNRDRFVFGSARSNNGIKYPRVSEQGTREVTTRAKYCLIHGQ